jgi:hypothetical protein
MMMSMAIIKSRAPQPLYGATDRKNSPQPVQALPHSDQCHNAVLRSLRRVHDQCSTHRAMPLSQCRSRLSTSKTGQEGSI